MKKKSSPSRVCRVLLDSNVWLAIITTDGACRSLWRRARTQVSLVASELIVGEVEEKLRTKFGFAPRHSRLMARFIQKQALITPVNAVPTVCRDTADNLILAAALAADCSCLVTGDSDLLILRTFEGIEIIQPRTFLDRLARSPSRQRSNLEADDQVDAPINAPPSTAAEVGRSGDRHHAGSNFADAHRLRRHYLAVR